MEADRCVSCGEIIPEGRQVCPICASECVGCDWDSPENCKACRGDKLEAGLKVVLDREVKRIRGD